MSRTNRRFANAVPVQRGRAGMTEIMTTNTSNLAMNVRRYFDSSCMCQFSVTVFIDAQVDVNEIKKGNKRITEFAFTPSA